MDEDTVLERVVDPHTTAVVGSLEEAHEILRDAIRWIEKNSELRAPDRPLPEIVVASREDVVRMTEGANLGENFTVGAAFNQRDNRVLFSVDTPMSSVVHEMVHWMQNDPDSPPGTEVRAYQLECLWLYQSLVVAMMMGDTANTRSLMGQLSSQHMALWEAARRRL